MTQNPSVRARGDRLRERDGGRLVDRELRGGGAAPESGADHRRHPHAVRDVAHAQQRRRRDRRGRRGEAARGDDADEGELRAAGEHHQAQHAGLPDVESGCHGQRAERDAVRARRERHAEALAHGAAPLTGAVRVVEVRFGAAWRRASTIGRHQQTPRSPRPGASAARDAS